jgi:hypothetical protein
MGAANRIQAWLYEPTRASQLWLGKRCAIAAWAGLLLAVATPPHGSDVSVCWLKNTTGLPCVGCGITRSLSCGLRGMFAESFYYHPMGLVILALLSLIALQTLLPEHLQDRLKGCLQKRAVAFNSLYLTFTGLFVVYGIARALFQYLELWTPSVR